MKRDELKNIMEQDSKKTFNRITKERYQWGNKANKHLARMLKKKKSINYIETIHNKNGEMVYTTKEIAKVFKSYYGALYSVKQKGQQVIEKIEETKEFLKNARLPLLSESERSMLEKPITEEEIHKALKDSALGKSLGPDGYTINYYKNYKEILVPKLCQYMNGL